VKKGIDHRDDDWRRATHCHQGAQINERALKALVKAAVTLKRSGRG
jgi:hypothetical protein